VGRKNQSGTLSLGTRSTPKPDPVWNRDGLPIFVHIPKTGGSSIRSLLKWSDQRCWKWGWTGGHAPAALIESKMPAGLFARTYKFTIIRNPWDRAVSWFYFMKKDNLEDLPVGRMALAESFHRWLNENAALTLGLMNRSAYTMLHRADGGRLVDNVFKYEELDSAWVEICKAIKRPHESLPVLNRVLSVRPTYKALFLDPRDVDLVKTMCWWEIQYHDYDFEH